MHGIIAAKKEIHHYGGETKKYCLLYCNKNDSLGYRTFIIRYHSQSFFGNVIEWSVLDYNNEHAT